MDLANKSVLLGTPAITARGELYISFSDMVSDPHIVKMSLELVNNGNPKRKEEAIGEDRMFIFYWLAQDKEYGITYLKGFDSNGNLIFQQESYHHF